MLCVVDWQPGSAVEGGYLYNLRRNIRRRAQKHEKILICATSCLSGRLEDVAVSASDDANRWVDVPRKILSELLCAAINPGPFNLVICHKETRVFTIHKFRQPGTSPKHRFVDGKHQTWFHDGFTSESDIMLGLLSTDHHCIRIWVSSDVFSWLNCHIQASQVGP